MVEFLKAQLWEAKTQIGVRQNIPPNTIKISVGFKPSPYFLPPEIKAVRHELEEAEKRRKQKEQESMKLFEEMFKKAFPNDGKRFREEFKLRFPKEYEKRFPKEPNPTQQH